MRAERKLPHLPYCITASCYLDMCITLRVFILLYKSKCCSQNLKTDSDIFSKATISAFVCTSLIDLEIFLTLLHIISQGS